ncbi:MAG TPA: Gfo/Idh/MocA family oxidoreductase [Dehalococcoidia bacterium]|nr:Gfo/Idh/MocA family oxidoreductase [Dehalococcoidia bacterium]
MSGSALRIGLVGAGLIARRSHLPAFAALPEARVTAVASGRLVSAEAAATEFSIPRVYESWEELIADQDVDAVDICTVNSLHAPIAIAAARAGKHVLVEKPMAVTLAQADEMIDAARRAGVLLMVAHNLRYVPVFEMLHEVVSSGRIGPIQTARGVFMHAGPDETWGAESDWFWRQEMAGGGAVLDLGIHMIDLLRWVVARPVLEVGAMVSRVAKPTFAEDNAFITMRFDGGILGSVQTSWTARPFPDNQVTIQGDEGRVIVGRTAAEPLVIYRQSAGGVEKDTPKIAEASRLGNLFSHFVSCVRDGNSPRVSGVDGRDSLAVALAAYESARAGQIVAVS